MGSVGLYEFFNVYNSSFIFLLLKRSISWTWEKPLLFLGAEDRNKYSEEVNTNRTGALGFNNVFFERGRAVQLVRVVRNASGSSPDQYDTFY